MLCRSRDLIRNCNAKRFCELHVDTIRSLLVSLNAIKRTQLLTEYNTRQQKTKRIREHTRDRPR